MHCPTHARAARTAALMTVLMIGATATAAAQAPTKQKDKPSPAMSHDMKDMKDKEMKDQHGMSGMMGPHHALAMAHRSSMATFGEVVSSHVAHATTVNVDLTRPAVAEMRRNFEQMKMHHQAHKATMGAHADSAMSGMMQHMDTHLTSVGQHMTMLESEVAKSAPDAKMVSQHIAAIMKDHDGMAKPPAAAAPHKM